MRAGLPTPFAAIAVVLLVGSASCSLGRSGEGNPSTTPADRYATSTAADSTPPPVDLGSDKPSRPYDEFLVAAVSDIERFWADGFEAVFGSTWTPLEGGVFAAWPDRDDPIPGCGTATSTYDDVATSGAFYCRDGDFIAYDDHELLPELVAVLGEQAVAIVLAHEFGHAVQARVGDFDRAVILKEQQADCFAGAWAAHVAHGAGSDVRFDDADVRAGLIAMIQIRDPVEAGGLANPEAHGTGFDRVGAFQDGFTGGIARCATFFTEDRLTRLIDIPFVSPFDDPNNGDLPLVDATGQGGDIVTLIPASLDRFWLPLLTRSGFRFAAPTLTAFSPADPPPRCDGIAGADIGGGAVWCQTTNTILLDLEAAADLLADRLAGDLSVAYLIATAYSSAVQATVGIVLDGVARALRDDCFSGAWVGANVPPATGDSVVELSAGDLDEAVVTLIDRSDPDDLTDEAGTAFEKVDAFRTGVLGGLQACLDA